jgi:branched-chain amino acid transport system substrate-binding protein
MEQTSKKIRIAVLIAIAVVAVSLFYLAFSGFAVKDDSRFKVGVLLPLSGTAAYYGEVSKNGIEIAREELKAEYPDLDIEVVYEDSFYTPKGGVDGYNKLKNADNINAVITAASQVSLAVLPISNEDKVFQMAIFSSADKYTTKDDLSFRVSSRNEIEAAKVAEFIEDKNYKKIAIIYLNNDFGAGFKDSLKAELSDSVKVVFEEGVLLTDSDFRTVLSKIKKEKPDSIFMVGTAVQYSLILKQAKEMNIDSQFLAMRSAEDHVLLKNAGAEAEGLIYTYPYDAESGDLESKKFSEAYQKKYGVVPDAYAAEGYLGFKLTALAYKECGNDAVCMKNYLENIKNQDSIFGKISFDENGDVYYDYFYKTVKEGEFVRL